MTKPLEGIRILDLSHMLPGPFCTMALADMGAEVIKVENPNGGDSFRSRKPLKRSEGTAFLMLNRGKRSVVADLKDPEGREFFLKLVETADVVLEQFKPGTARKLGIDYTAVAERNPSIIYCSLSGYGQNGAYADMPGHDINYLSMSGVLDTIGSEGSAPVIPGVQIADVGGGAQWALVSILLGLLSRNASGEGCYLDVSMARCLVPWMTLYLSQYAVDGLVPSRGSTKGGGHFACYRIYRTKDDRYVSLGAAEPKFWAKFCRLVDRSDLIEDQYAEGTRREELIAALEELFASQSQAHWVERLMGEQVCFTPVRSFDEVVNDEAFSSGGLIGTTYHPREGEMLSIGFPVPLEGVATEETPPAPAYGQDTEAYLNEVGYDEMFIRAYQKRMGR